MVERDIDVRKKDIAGIGRDGRRKDIVGAVWMSGRRILRE